MQQQLILGFSGNLLAMLLEIMQQQGNRGPFTILKNIPDGDRAVSPFIPEGMEISIVESGENFMIQDTYTAFFGVYTPWVKQKVFNHFLSRQIPEQAYSHPIHPSAVIASTARLERAIHLEALSVVSSFATLSFGVTVNRNSSIGHHSHVGRFVTLGPGVNIGGHCKIGDLVQIGIGAAVFNDVTIGKNSIIGGGSVVTADIPENVVAWGNPCKVIRPVTPH